MPVQVGTNLSVQGFGYIGDGSSKRLVGPRVEGHDLTGRAGSLKWAVADLLLDKVEGRLDVTRWAAEAASLGTARLVDDSGKLDVAIDRVEMPNGMALASGAKGVEILSPHFTLSEVRLTVLNPAPADDAPADPPPAAPAKAAPPSGLRQEQLRFLDSLAGHVDVTVKVKLHLPVIGTRTLDQALDVKIQDGSLDYRALEDQLDWLEGRFLDFKHTDDRLAVTWRVPIFGSKHELIAWHLDPEAATLASFGRVPVRALADYELPKKDDDDTDTEDAADKKPEHHDDKGEGDGLLRQLTLDAIDVALSLLAPRTFEVGGGMIAFGGDGQPGMVDLKVTGRVALHGPGALHGSIGALDTTIKDLQLGGIVMSADRLSIDGIDALEVEFDGFRLVKATMVIHRVTATNLVVKIGA